MATDMTDAQQTKKTKRYYTKHGLTTLKKAVRVLGGRAVDRRTALGRALPKAVAGILMTSIQG